MAASPVMIAREQRMIPAGNPRIPWPNIGSKPDGRQSEESHESTASMDFSANSWITGSQKGDRCDENNHMGNTPFFNVREVKSSVWTGATAGRFANNGALF